MGKKLMKTKKKVQEPAKGAGRPCKTYTPAQLKEIDRLAKEGHKTGTIAVALGIDHETLEANFSQRMAQKRVEGKIKLKRAQIQKAIGQKDSTMLVWLGKNELDQTDKTKQTVNLADEFKDFIRELDGTSKGLPKHNDQG
jgi:hypothetical protein